MGNRFNTLAYKVTENENNISERKSQLCGKKFDIKL